MMLNLFNPWVLAGILALVISVGSYEHHAGYKQKETEDALLIAKKNQQMNDAKEQADVKLSQAQKALATKQSNLIDAIRSGQQRLSIPTTTGCSSAATGDGQERTQLDGSVSEALVAITGDGDSAIVQLNSCIDRYNQVRDIASGNR